MKDIQYYFSPDGSDVSGPVTKEALRQLFFNGTINASYYFCQEGASEWQQLDPGACPVAGEILCAEIPSSGSNDRLDGLWSAWVEIMESVSVRISCYALYVIMPVVLGFILTSHHAHTLPATEHTEDYIGPLAGYFLGVNAVLAIIVYLVGVPFPHAYRLWIRAGALLLLAVPVAAGLIL